MFEKIKKYYDMHIYTKDQVKVFVQKGIITAAQYKEITGEKYDG